MRRWLTGLGSGFLVGLLLAGGVAYVWAESQVEYARYMGQLDALGEVFMSLRDELGETTSGHGGKSLFSLKTSHAILVEVDGVKTLRVLP